MSFFGFHPLIAEWFASRFDQPTEPQAEGWPHIAAGKHTLIAAPTGSGKTLTAFLAQIDRLFKMHLQGGLGNETRVVYVSPLRALSNDMHRNLKEPLEEIRHLAAQQQIEVPPVTVGLRTADTTSSQRAAMVRKPKHILVTTPESLYLMLTGPKSRQTLRTVETVIVDEIHALVRDKRGSHLAITLERLEALCDQPLQRIGLSATQKPMEKVAEFLGGYESTQQTEPTAKSRPVISVNVGHRRELDLAIEVPERDLGPICTHEHWAEVYERLVTLIQKHRSTLVFVNTRRMAERVTHQLTELLGEDVVAAHHGSLAAEIRLGTEQRLKTGQLKAVVATASLELGLDIGYIDQVIQIGSPRSIATFLQRVGRSGHSLGLIPKGRLFALTRDELMEAMALIRAVRAGRLDTLIIPEAPLDVLAQQIVAEVSTGERHTDELFEMVCQAAPYRNLSRQDFDKTVQFLSEGLTSHSSRGRVYLHHDQVNKRVRARQGSTIVATSNGGAIPEIASYRVVVEPEKTVVGTLDEDFAIESNRGDVFLLGNTSWRIERLRGGDMLVRDAHGAPPTIPFWRGEAPGRSVELSAEISRLREELSNRIETPSSAKDWLVAETACTPAAAQLIVLYVTAQQAALGVVPTQKQVVYERFFDETGGMQIVVHAPFGSAITKAWAFAQRKRFCRAFDFELQATADDDGFLLSIGPQHSFPLESLFPTLTTANARNLVEQSVLAVPLFEVRWRWNVTRALMVLRQQNGKKVPPALQRFRADDLLTAVFPKLTGCQENITGDHEIPDHPLVQQTMHDCLNEALHIDGLHAVLSQIENGEIELIARDTREPSPFCYELLNANPYAFLDGGEIQERRARAVATRQSLNVEALQDLGKLDPLAIETVVRDAQPFVRNADELHDLLLCRLLLPTDDVLLPERGRWKPWFEVLADQRRAVEVALPKGKTAWVAAERLPAIRAIFPDLELPEEMNIPDGVRMDWESAEARVAIIRGLMETCGPITLEDVADRCCFTASQSAAALEALEGEGDVLRGDFLPNRSKSSEGKEREWCHRRLLSRIHRATMAGLRRQIEPVDSATYIRFLTRHQGLLEGRQRAGINGLFEIIGQLEGIDIPAVAWEKDILPRRLNEYRPDWLDQLTLQGEMTWGRLYPPQKREPRKTIQSITKAIPVSFWLRADGNWLIDAHQELLLHQLTSPAQCVLELLEGEGARFISEIQSRTDLLPTQVQQALGELITNGWVTADGIAGLRNMIGAKQVRKPSQARTRRGGLVRSRYRSDQLQAREPGIEGRWSLWRTRATEEGEETDCVGPAERMEQWAWLLLRRWGVVFRDLLAREAGAPAWYELLGVYRRLEARGEIRGGRFISGVAGEQFAVSETVRVLRRLREAGPKQELVQLSAADPLNLVGIITNHPRIPSTANNQVVYQDGRPILAKQADCWRWLADVPVGRQQQIAQQLGVTAPIATAAIAMAARQQPIEHAETTLVD